MDTFLSSGLPLLWTFRIATRPFMSGRSRMTWRSKRPGRRSAGSRTSGRLVAATTMTFVFVSKPSISTRIWLSVCSRSSWLPPRPAPRWRPTASISSTKTMHGLLRFAWSNRSRTRLAPTPTNISTNSEPEMLKNGTPASPATARAMSVLPVPGGPTRSTPRGIRAPRVLNFSGNLRNSTTSWSSVFASSTPATSANVTMVLLAEEHPGSALPEGEGLVIGALGLAHHEVDEPADHEERQEPGQQQADPRVVGRLLCASRSSEFQVWPPSSAAWRMSSRTWVRTLGTTTE